MPHLSIDQECPTGRALRQAFAENIGRRHRNGQFAATAKLQRAMLHAALQAKVGARALPDAAAPEILTAAEREALKTFWLENVRGPQDVIALPSAARASHVGKVACAAVLAAALIMVFGWDETVGAAMSALPIPKLIAAAFGRIV